MQSSSLKDQLSSNPKPLPQYFAKPLPILFTNLNRLTENNKKDIFEHRGEKNEISSSIDKDSYNYSLSIKLRREFKRFAK